MEPASIPETIRTIIAQAGGLGLRGAFTYLGARQFRYRCARPEGEYRSAYPSRLTSEAHHRLALLVHLHRQRRRLRLGVTYAH